MCLYLRYPTFSRFDTIPECDRHTHTDRQTAGPDLAGGGLGPGPLNPTLTDRHTTTAYTALSIASRGKNYTIGTSLLSVSVSVPWNSSFSDDATTAKRASFVQIGRRRASCFRHLPPTGAPLSLKINHGRSQIRRRN